MFPPPPPPSAPARLALATVALALAVTATSACDSDSPPDGKPAETAAVVASTTWVGALARAAGATDVAVIAPANIPDQAAFDPTPTELEPAARSEHVLYAETDGFAAALKNAAGDAHLMSVRPVNTVPAIRSEVTRLAEVFGTRDAATRWLSTFEAQVDALSGSLKGLAPIPPLTAVAQADVAYWATFAGVRTVASYGPAPVTRDQLAALSAKKPKLLLANVHRPAGTPDIPGTIRVDLANYPGEDLNLLAVFQTNAARISATFAK